MDEKLIKEGLDGLGFGVISKSNQHEPEPEPSFNKPKGVTEYKFMLTLTQYPDGRVFPKIFPIGVRQVDKRKNKGKGKKALKQVTLQQEESY